MVGTNLSPRDVIFFSTTDQEWLVLSRGSYMLSGKSTSWAFSSIFFHSRFFPVFFSFFSSFYDLFLGLLFIVVFVVLCKSYLMY